MARATDREPKAAPQPEMRVAANDLLKLGWAISSCQGFREKLCWPMTGK